MFKRFLPLMLPFMLPLLMLAPVGCGDDDNQTQNDAAVQDDAETQDDAAQNDAEVGDAGPETQGCTGESPESPVGLGGCCNENTDCSAGGECRLGWCSRNCDSDADCDVTVPGPFVTGTPTRCNTNQLGWTSWCVPGSLQDCGSEGDSPCPTGEVCIGGWNDDGTVRTEAYRGVCATAMTQPGVSSAAASPRSDTRTPGSTSAKRPGIYTPAGTAAAAPTAVTRTTR